MLLISNFYSTSVDINQCHTKAKPHSDKDPEDSHLRYCIAYCISYDFQFVVYRL